MAAATAAFSDSSSESSVYAVSEEKTNGTRLVRLLVDGGTHVLRKVLDSIHPPATLQPELANNLRSLHGLKSRRVISDGQWEKLFPTSGDLPDSKTFDITLLHLSLRKICHLTAPRTGWHKMPADGDVSLEANMVRIKCFRNELCHSVSTSIAKDEFEDKWNSDSSALVALGLDQTEVDRLKSEPIDHDTKRRIEEEVNKWKLADCLPDEVVNFFGRSQEIEQVMQHINTRKVGIVLITGGPGFGKTTVAKKVGYELAATGSENAVLFCPLRWKSTVNDVATSMILACSENHFQPP